MRRGERLYIWRISILHETLIEDSQSPRGGGLDEEWMTPLHTDY